MLMHCFLDIADIAECCLLVMPSPEAIANSEVAYYDDYYIQLKLSATEGALYNKLYQDICICSIQTWMQSKAANSLSQSGHRKAIATLHFKVRALNRR